MSDDPRRRCPHCDGSRTFAGKPCTRCGGTGTILVVVDDDDKPPKPRAGSASETVTSYLPLKISATFTAVSGSRFLTIFVVKKGIGDFKFETIGFTRQS